MTNILAKNVNFKFFPPLKQEDNMSENFYNSFQMAQKYFKKILNLQTQGEKRIQINQKQGEHLIVKRILMVIIASFWLTFFLFLSTWNYYTLFHSSVSQRITLQHLLSSSKYKELYSNRQRISKCLSNYTCTHSNAQPTHWELII